MTLHLPYSWPRMSPYARINYLCDTFQCKDRREAGRIVRGPSVKTTPEAKLAAYRKSMERMKLF